MVRETMLGSVKNATDTSKSWIDSGATESSEASSERRAGWWLSWTLVALEGPLFSLGFSVEFSCASSARMGTNSDSVLNLKSSPLARSTGIVHLDVHCETGVKRLTVYGEGRDAEEGLVDLDEPRLELAVLSRDDDPPGEPEVAVEPRVPDAAAVELDADLHVPELGPLRHGPDLTFAGGEDGNGSVG